LKEHAEESRESPSPIDPAVTAMPGSLSLAAREVLSLQRSAGNRAVSRLLQRRTAEPTRSDKTQTFTYSLKLYTVDDDSYQEAKEVAATLNAFTSRVTDFMTQRVYTVRFKLSVHPPPKPDVLEAAFGEELHYRVGRKRLRPRRAREAAERWWLGVMRKPGDTGNLYLGNHPPSEETKAYLDEVAKGMGTSSEAALWANTEMQLRAAKTDADKEAIKAQHRKDLHALRENPPEEAIAATLDNPDPQSRGTTFAGRVLQMRAPRGAQFSLNVRVHEVMHLLGFSTDHTDERVSVMSYPYMTRNRDKSVMPSAADIKQLVEADNPPSLNSID
jgi:hypothetical protein